MTDPYTAPLVGDVVRESEALARLHRREPVTRTVTALPAPGEVTYRSSLRRGLAVTVDLERWREVVAPGNDARPGWEVVKRAERLEVDLAKPGSDRTVTFRRPNPFAFTKQTAAEVWAGTQAGRSTLTQRLLNIDYRKLAERMGVLESDGDTIRLRPTFDAKDAQGTAVDPGDLAEAMERPTGFDSLAGKPKGIIDRIEDAVAKYLGNFNEPPNQVHLGPEELERLRKQSACDYMVWDYIPEGSVFMGMIVRRHEDDIVPFVSGREGNVRIAEHSAF